MKNILMVLMAVVFGTLTAQAQETNWKKIYDPSLNGKAQIEQAVALAKKEGKKVMVQVGGNWCPYCIRLNKFVMTDPELKQMVDDNFVYVHLNYSKENKNLELLESWGNPQKNGFPVLVFLNKKGKVTHVQPTGDLEKDKSYNKAQLVKVYQDNK